MSYELVMTLSYGELAIFVVLASLFIQKLVDDIISWYQSRDNGRDNDDVK